MSAVVVRLVFHDQAMHRKQNDEQISRAQGTKIINIYQQTINNNFIYDYTGCPKKKYLF